MAEEHDLAKSTRLAQRRRTDSGLESGTETLLIQTDPSSMPPIGENLKFPATPARRHKNDNEADGDYGADRDVP